MKTYKKSILLFMLAAALICSISVAQTNTKTDIRTLEGDWEGNGEFLVPMTGMRVSIAGKANFQYNHEEGYLRTALLGDKFMFTYSDSGHLVHDVETDSISWEVWDNFGKHALYHGEVDGNLIHGSRLRKNKIYSVTIELVTADSIDFRLTTTDPDGDSVDRATFNLWRVKE